MLSLLYKGDYLHSLKHDISTMDVISEFEFTLNEKPV